MKEYVNIHNKDDVHKILKETVSSIDEQTCCRIIMNVANNVTEQVINYEDMWIS